MKSKLITKQNVWARELWILSYFVFFCVSLLQKVLPGVVALSLVQYGVRLLYAPLMIFAVGLHIFSEDPTKEDFKKKMFQNFGVCYILFVGIGLITECLFHHRAPYATIKDLIVLNRIPGFCAIFLTMAVFYLIAALFYPTIDKIISSNVLTVLCSFAGILTIFIPEGLIGYGMFGIFIGGDRFGCIAATPYLFLFFLTGILTKKNITSLMQKEVLFPFGISFGVGVLIILIHSITDGMIFVSAGISFLFLLISRLILPLYCMIERKVVELGYKMLQSFVRFYQKNRSGKKGLFIFTIGYCILFVIMGIFIFAPYIEKGSTLIWSVDGLGQYVPKIHRFMRYIPEVTREILHGNMNFQQYDFTSGLGSTVSISYDPIYWLYLLFPVSSIETAYSALIIFRFFLTGLSMAAMLLYFKKSWISVYTASMMYTFCGYALYAGTRHGQFITPMFLLPLLVIAMEQLIRHKKWYLLTALVAFSLLCSYYFLYMNTIAIGIYFVTRILCDKKYRNFKLFFTRGLIIVGSYVIGASIGIISIFTSFASYMGSSRTQGQSADGFLTTTPLFYRTEWIPDSFVAMLSDQYSPGLWIKFGFGPLAILAIILLFTRKRQKELKPLFFMGVISIVIPAVGYIFAGFSNVNNRWCYIFAALIAFILAEYFECFDNLSGKELCIILCVDLFYGALIMFSTKYRTVEVLAGYGFLLLITAIVFLLNSQKIRITRLAGYGLLFGVSMFVIIFNANLFMTKGSHMDTYVEKGKSLSSMSRTALRFLPEVENKPEEYYRSTNLKTYGNTRSSSLIYGYNDVSTFTSTLASGIVDYNSAMGNCGWNIVSIYDYNARTIMHELASVRYIGTDEKSGDVLPFGYQKVFTKKSGKHDYSIYENEYALPLGYTYDSVISAEEADTLSAAEKQELTLHTAIVSDKQKEISSSLPTLENAKDTLDVHPIKIEKMKLSKITDQDGKFIIEEAGASMEITFAGEANSETYLSLKGDIEKPKDSKEHFMNAKVSAKGMSYSYKFRVDNYNTGQEERLFNLGYHEEPITSCKIVFDSPGVIEYTDLAVYSQPMDNYPAYTAALSENVMTDIVTETNTVTGKISLDQNKMLVITLPYQTGWTAYVDGEKTEIQNVNYQYMGLNLQPGEHEIRLEYRIPGLKYAFLITISGVVVFVGIILFNYVRKRRRK